MNNNELDLLNAISIILGLQNLRENREQSAHNDVERANSKQADYLLTKINERFAEQNELLAMIYGTIQLILQEVSKND